MRSLSLESITANKNMKLLSLLVTLLALSYATSNTATVFSELLHSLEKLEKHQFNALNKSVRIQTPLEVKNACDCEDSIAGHLKHFLWSFKIVIPRVQLANILDNLDYFNLRIKPNDNCRFQTHNLTNLTTDNFKTFIQNYTEFIQNWNAHCK